MTKLFSISFALMAFISVSYACTCIPFESDDDELEQTLCEFNPDFVGIVKLINDGTVRRYERKFEVITCETLIGDPTNEIVTAQDSAACGVYGESGDKLLVSAKFNENGDLSANLCRSLWSPIDSDDQLLTQVRNKLQTC